MLALPSANARSVKQRDGWLTPPPRSVMEDYWRGVQMIPERHLVVAKLDKVIAGSCQIVRPPRNNEAQAFTCQLTTFFVAPWARGHGLAQMIVERRALRAASLLLLRFSRAHRGLMRFWPELSSTKSILFLNELDELNELD